MWKYLLPCPWTMLLKEYSQCLFNCRMDFRPVGNDLNYQTHSCEIMLSVSPFQNNPKDVEPSVEMDLDFWIVFEGKKTFVLEL